MKANKAKSKSGFERYEYILAGIKNSKPLTIKQIRTIFLILLDDYFSNEIEEYFLESVASDLCFNFSKSPNHILTTDKELGTALVVASDITYYLERAKKDTECKKTLRLNSKILKDYYNKNKLNLKTDNQ